SRSRLLDSALPPACADNSRRLAQRHELMATGLVPAFPSFPPLADLKNFAARMVLEDRGKQAGERLCVEDGDFETLVRLVVPTGLSSATVRRRVDCPHAGRRRARDP